VLLALGIVAAWVATTLFTARWAPTWRAHESPAPPPLPWMSWFHRGVVAAWGLAGLWVVVHRVRRGPSFALNTMLLGLATSALLAAALAAAQLVPVWEFTSRSLRAAEGKHDIWGFSLHPLQLAGLLWPNFYGDSFAHNRSWFDVFHPVGKHALAWAPSLYLGGLTLVLALGALGFRDGPPWRAWLTGVAALSLLASLGEYSSPLWWARWIPPIAHEVGPHDPMLTGPIRADSYLRDGDGGLYWILAAFLPGFGQFRFPSKLLIFTMLALTALAGLGWDRISATREVRTARLAAVLLVLTLAGLVLAALGHDWILARFAPGGPSDPASLFGPLDASGAYRELCFSLAQGTVVLALALAVALYGWRRPALSGALALTLTTADLAWANTRYVLTVPQQIMNVEPKAVRIIAEAERKDPAGQPFRVHRMPFWYPFQWQKEESEDRVREIVAWERDTIPSKYGLPYGIEYTLTKGTTELHDTEWFFVGSYQPVYGAFAQALGLRPGDEVFYWPRRAFDLWNTRYFVVPANPRGWKEMSCSYAAFLEQADRIYPVPDAFVGPQGKDLLGQWIYREDLQVFRNEAAYPRAWVVHQARFHRSVTGMDESGREALVGRILHGGEISRNNEPRAYFGPRVLAWVEAEKRGELAGYLSRIGPQASESVTITSYSPQRVELDAVLEQPGLVILADVDYPGWRLTIDDEPAPIYRANILMRAAAVKSGRHRLVYTYQPESFYFGRWASVAGLVVMGALAAWFWQRPLTPSLAAGESSRPARLDG
jgi:hypothetical protein